MSLACAKAALMTKQLITQARLYLSQVQKALAAQAIEKQMQGRAQGGGLTQYSRPSQYVR
jgi:hypothetical protein